MNFAPFTNHIPSSAGVPTIHQFAAKFGYENTNTVLQETRYQGGAVQFVSPAGAAEGKFRQDSVVVVSAAPPALPAQALHTVNTGVKYQTITQASSSVNVGNIAYGHTYVPHDAGLKTEQRDNIIMQHHVGAAPSQQGGQQLVLVLHEPKEAASLARAIKQEGRGEAAAASAEYISIGDVTDSACWQTLGGGVADYLSALPLPLHHLLKYSCDKEPTIVTVNANTLQPVSTNIQANVNSLVVQTATIVNQTTLNSNAVNTVAVARRRKKKKSVKEKKPKPKPGEIRLTTALDGSTLYCCPECHMAYPERGLLEQHLVGHTMERRFICDICNAALKRKDHLTRHKQSHNSQRPHVCSVCQKAFKRKEQLTLHFVIHSGDKRHVCSDCGKGFYRKDHLRKHTRSHIARRVKAELSQQHAPAEALPGAVPAPAPPPPS